MQVSLEDAPQEGNPLVELWNKFWSRASSDPFYAVLAYRNFKRVDE